jgi:hypothetical protein
VAKAEAHVYRSGCQARVLAGLLPARLSATPQPGDQAGVLPFGVCVPIEAEEGEAALVRLPDGRRWWVRRNGLLLNQDCPKPDSEGIAAPSRQSGALSGPLSVGGRSSSALIVLDHSLVNLWGSYTTTPTNNFGRELRSKCTAARRPDLFGEHDPDQPNARFASITHVAISAAMRSSMPPAPQDVTLNSLDPGSSIYRAWLRENLAGARRFV